MSNRWYLAYGSNLSSEKFRGTRGIRPLAEANVAVPSLELTFDLPGIPYWEPCFANVRMQKDGGNDACDQWGAATIIEKFKPGRVLMGVAYLVTPEDYAHILATEGGGASYEEVDVECWQVSDTTAEENRRIIASTLLAPDSRRRSAPMQPSKRYIDIIRAGARGKSMIWKLFSESGQGESSLIIPEHHMPASYIAYLDNISYYRITSLRQRIGATLFLAAWLPPLLVIYLLQMLFTDRETGLVPRWLGFLTELGISAMWNNYLRVWKRIFGSGEVADSHRVSGVLGNLELGQKKDQQTDGSIGQIMTYDY